ncbi:MAG: hypothetical protein M5R40_21930 [Anaerolineae bacterium]|nr:hypothetical protein [Anaerolineae bacterium]
MQLRTEILTLHLRTPFRIAHGVSETRQSVIVYLEDAVGEAALAPYYGVTPEHVIAYLSDPRVEAALDGDLLLREDILDRLPPGPMPARAAWTSPCTTSRASAWARRCIGCGASTWADAAQFLYHQPGDRRSRAAAAPPRGGRLSNSQAQAWHRRPRRRPAHGAHRPRSHQRAALRGRQRGLVRGRGRRHHPRLAGFGLLFVEQPLARDDIAGWHKLRARLPADMPPPDRRRVGAHDKGHPPRWPALPTV